MKKSLLSLALALCAFVLPAQSAVLHDTTLYGYTPEAVTFLDASWNFYGDTITYWEADVFVQDDGPGYIAFTYYGASTWVVTYDVDANAVNWTQTSELSTFFTNAMIDVVNLIYTP